MTFGTPYLVVELSFWDNFFFRILLVLPSMRCHENLEITFSDFLYGLSDHITFLLEFWGKKLNQNWKFYWNKIFNLLTSRADFTFPFFRLTFLFCSDISKKVYLQNLKTDVNERNHFCLNFDISVTFEHFFENISML